MMMKKKKMMIIEVNIVFKFDLKQRKKLNFNQHK